MYGSFDKQFITFCSDGKLITAGKEGKVNFWVNEDGSSSVGCGPEGFSTFLSLSDTPNKIVNNKLLGGINGNKVGFIDDANLNNLNVKSLECADVQVDGVLKVRGNINNLNTFESKAINVSDVITGKNAEFEEIVAEGLDCQKIDTLKLKADDIVGQDLLIGNIELEGEISIPTKIIGSYEKPVEISRATDYVFELGDKAQLVIFGKHFKQEMEFIVKTFDANVCHKKLVTVDVMGLYGEELLITGKMIKQVLANEILVRITFDKPYKNDIIEKVVVKVH